MNRRSFLKAGAATAAILPTYRAVALDIDVIQSPIMEVLRHLPRRPGPAGEEFAITHGTNNRLARSAASVIDPVDMYWDPELEDYDTIFGIYDSWIELGGGQDGLSLWFMGEGTYEHETSKQTLQSNGWEIVDEELGLMHYTGTDDERSKLAASLNILGSVLRGGFWDWVAIPDERAIVVGPDKVLVRTVADRVKHYSAMRTADESFHGLRYILRPDTFGMSLIPRQALPVENSDASFISRSWTGDTPVVQSIGLRLDSPDLIETMHNAVHCRLESETSTINGLRYKDFLTIDGTEFHNSAFRIDLIDTSGEYDLGQAFAAGDLRMLPLIDADT